MKHTSIKSKLTAILLTFCMAISLVPTTAFGADINYIKNVNVAYTQKDYKAGDAPHATASVTNSDAHCKVAYECWREIYQKEEGGVWYGTGRYWYSDAKKMAELSDDKKITNFEEGKHYNYQIVLEADSGYFFSDDDTAVSVGEYEWGVPNKSTNLEIKDMSTSLYIYGIYSLDMTPVTNTNIIDATLSYKAGDTPKATAKTNWRDKNGYDYEVYDEYWEEMASDGNGGLIPVKYWHSNEEENAKVSDGKLITTFEEGKSYMYSLTLKAIKGHTFSNSCTMTLNGKAVDQRNISVNNEYTLFATALKTIKPTAQTEWQPIDVIEINDATISFNAGDKPVFTGNVPDNEDYAFRCEWWSLDSDTGLVSTEPEWGSEIYKNKITTFEAGKTYHYGVYVSAYYGEFSPDTKLKINGQYVNYKRVGDADDMQSMWLETDLTMTPQVSGTIPEYKIIEGANSSWTQNTDGTLTFRADGDFNKFIGVKVDGKLIDAKNYIAASGSTVITLKADYLKTLSAGMHKLTVVYLDGECITNFDIKLGENNKLSDSSSPLQTGDSSNLVLWFALLFVSGGIFANTMIFSRKYKNNIDK